MNVPAIHVHTQCDTNTVQYVTFMWEMMRALANHPGALTLTVHYMGPSPSNHLLSLSAAHVDRMPGATNDADLAGSRGHATCVERALEQTDDGDIHIIVDADTVVIARGWDDHVRIELLDKQVGLIGTRYEDVGGVTSGSTKSQTYKLVPNVVWMAMSPLHRWQDLRAQPQKDSDLVITNEGMSRIYGLPVGYQVFRDVGWQIPEYLAHRDISCFGWRQLKPGSGDAPVLRGLSDYHEEYHVDDSIPFVVHHRGSLRHPYRGNTMSQAFYTAVDTYIEKELKRPPRWVWVHNANNEQVLPLLAAAKESARLRRQALDVPLTTEPSLERTPDNNAWTKVVIDGENVWSRHEKPAPNILTVRFTPDQVTRNIRIEGTVPALGIVLPSTQKRQYTLTVRNMLNGPTTVNVKDATRTLEVPAGACWLVLIDVDGPVHVC